MKTARLSTVLCFLLVSLVSCLENYSKNYRDLGKFGTRVEAENKAIQHLINDYTSLPTEDYYRVMYEFKDNQWQPKEGMTHLHALWYHKGNQQLKIELDFHSGTACGWSNVSLNTLQQVLQSKQGLVTLDSLVKLTNPEKVSCLKK